MQQILELFASVSVVNAAVARAAFLDSFTTLAKVSGMTSRHDLAETLRQRLLSGAHLGVFRAGERLPSVRQLAEEFGVGPRSVLAAYRALEREGIVELRERSGIFFGTRGRSATHEGDVTLSTDEAWALDVFQAGYVRGRAIPSVLTELGRYATCSQLRVAAIECNDDQISGLTAALRSDFGLDAVGLNVDDLLASSPPSLHGISLLVTTVFHAGEVQDLAARAGTSWLAISYRSDVFAEIARLLPTMPVHFVVNDPRFERKLEKIYSSLPGAANLHIVRVGDIDSVALPADAIIYASHSARELLKGHSIISRIVVATPLVSDDSAREILSFIVRSNVAALSADDDR